MFTLQTTDNIFDLFPELIVHPVNCTGLCKDAFSKQIKKTWPEYFRTYSRACIRKSLQPGKPMVYEENSLFGTRFIVALPLKNHWQEKLNPPLVKDALSALVEVCHTNRISTLAIPNFEGPPAGWLEGELRKRFEAAGGTPPDTIILF